MLNVRCLLILLIVCVKITINIQVSNYFLDTRRFFFISYWHLTRFQLLQVLLALYLVSCFFFVRFVCVFGIDLMNKALFQVVKVCSMLYYYTTLRFREGLTPKKCLATPHPECACPKPVACNSLMWIIFVFRLLHCK